MALFLKDFDDDLRRQLRILALEHKMTLNQLIEMFLKTQIKIERKRKRT